MELLTTHLLNSLPSCHLRQIQSQLSTHGPPLLSSLHTHTPQQEFTLRRGFHAKDKRSGKTERERGHPSLSCLGFWLSWTMNSWLCQPQFPTRRTLCRQEDP